MPKTMSEKNWFFFQFHSGFEAGEKKILKFEAGKYRAKKK
jgi:hypothetical protein